MRTVQLITWTVKHVSWAASCEKVPNGLSRYHTKRRIFRGKIKKESKKSVAYQKKDGRGQRLRTLGTFLRNVTQFSVAQMTKLRKYLIHMNHDLEIHLLFYQMTHYMYFLSSIK